MRSARCRPVSRVSALGGGGNEKPRQKNTLLPGQFRQPAGTDLVGGSPVYLPLTMGARHCVDGL